ncbi:HEPN domain-containing protein [Candidatus Bathyarchaeota archaeon]|nr:HEPN domain-containing protein [Candidatus Bathyarchaeota archaeon]
MSFNPLGEVRYRYRLAVEQLERAERLFSLRDWSGTVSASQLAVENFAKAVIATFEVPTWSHDPSNQLNSLIDRLPIEAMDEAKELAALAREVAPEHGRSSYGEPTTGLLPSDIYREDHASNALKKGRKARAIAKRVLDMLNVKL